MAVLLQGGSGLTIGGGEEASAPLHIAQHPVQGNWYRLAAFTGTIAAATGANAEIFQFRFVSGAGKNFALIYKVIFDGIGIVAVATAAGPIGFNMFPARSWTVAGSGGTRIATTGDNLQTETALPASQVNDIGIATTAALTSGTKTVDANAQGHAIGAVGTGAVTTYQAQGTPIVPQPLYEASAAGGQPLVLANQEGFVIRTTHAGPTALTYTAGFTVVWCEVTAF
jgi:hypothetical protein